MKETTKPQNSDVEDKHVERVRRICLALPETWEKISHGEPTFFVKKKVFATCSINHHNDGHVAVVIPAAIGIQEMLVKKSPRKFYRPPYVGVRGWVGVELNLEKAVSVGQHVQQASVPRTLGRRRTRSSIGPVGYVVHLDKDPGQTRTGFIGDSPGQLIALSRWRHGSRRRW